MQILRGIAVSPGLAIGSPTVIDPRGVRLVTRELPAEEVDAEIERLAQGIESARLAAEEAERDARKRLEPQYADILRAHVRLIDDASLRREAELRIRNDLISAEQAAFEVLDGYAARLERLSDAYLAARAADVRDIQHRLLEHLGDHPAPAAPGASADGEPCVILAYDLSPSQTAGLDPAKVLGFATEAGGAASHTAIVAAALEIPAVVGLGRYLDRARRCHMAIIDGDEGLVVLDPDEATLDRYRHAARERAARFAGLMSQAELPAETLDGQRVGLLGNIEFPEEVAACAERGADGIGLYRTEFLYLNAAFEPTEDEQVAVYRRVVESLQGRPVTFRTLDLGTDKLVRDSTPLAEANPSLGLRSLRLSLREPASFRIQLRALLRVSTLGDVRIMFPLVTTIGEWRRARAILNEVASELRAEGHAVRSDLPVGAMIEVPAAALMADHLARETDFFSIGTNDLIQYALAADRTNEAVSELYNAADPAVLRMIAMVVEAARAQSINVTVCGAMAGDPLYTCLLLGLGVSHLSTTPHQLPEIKRVIRTVRLAEARALAAEALRCDTAESVMALLRNSQHESSQDHQPRQPSYGRGR